MAIKDFIKSENILTVVCDAKGKAIKLEKAQASANMRNKEIIGTDIFPTETGKMMYVWID
jgi:hypothetical protein